MTPTQEKQAKQFKRLDLACISFRECKAITEHLMKLGIAPDSAEAPLYSACCAGMMATYARPFLEAEGLGSLPPRYAEGFTTPEMDALHRNLLEARHQVFAHRDLIRTKVAKLHPDSHPVLFESRIIIAPSASGKGASIHSEPALLYFLKSRLPDVVALCEFQIERTTRDAVALLVNMAGTKPYKPGTYVVGQDFP